MSESMGQNVFIFIYFLAVVLLKKDICYTMFDFQQLCSEKQLKDIKFNSISSNQ